MKFNSHWFLAASVAVIAVAAYNLDDGLQGDLKKDLPALQMSAESVFLGAPVMAKLAVAQAILESGLQDKPSKLALQGNNLFGIKYNKNKHKNYIELETTECVKKKCHKIVAKFAKFSSIYESFEALKVVYDHPRYKEVHKASSCSEAGYAAKKAGYATDPNYSKKIAVICSRYDSNMIP